MKEKLIYLAVPFSHPLKEVRDARNYVVNHVAASMIRDGLAVFSPISHSTDIMKLLQNGTQLTNGWEVMCRTDMRLLSHCDEMWIITLPGWEKSVGVTAEKKKAEELGIPVKMLDDVAAHYVQEIPTLTA